jgi:FAD/FMN-containing dehydrogenase
MPQAFPTKHLERRLRRAIRGEVRFDNGSHALYSTDSSNYRQIPIGVVIPRAEADVVETVAICRELGIPITSRGGGTSLAGQCCNVAVIIDFSKYLHHLIEADPNRKIARVEPGIIYDDVNRAVAKHKLASLYPYPLHDRRNDWKQFLRRTFRHGRICRKRCSHI